MKYLLFYELAENAGPITQQHFPTHRERLMQFSERGVLLMVGTFTDPPAGAMAVFTSREALQEFMSDDPFVRHGVVGAHQIREWDEILQP